MWLPILGLILGLAIGYVSPFSVPINYAKYLSVAILAALDSVLGGIRAAQEDHFDSTVFLTGFFSNILLAGILAYVGDRIGVDLYLAAVVAFGVRLFQNLAIIRRHWLRK
ncbi:MAG: small basic family protein [Desulfitobacteriaceae bacterium]|nr:small basic family protein [Desulfitobacteriaceae bacterium]MDI6879281.1 small basic family protein [Desulfitobacteriaceae bacterium]MDI6914254.1 small basic family protein [Desulfitobacteriaceae bacterium]